MSDINKKIDEAMMPELGGKKIKVGSSEITVTEMPIFYVKRLNRALEPVYSLIGGAKDISLENVLSVASVDKFYDIIMDVSLVILERYDKNITRETLEQTATENQLVTLIKTQLEVNGMINFLKDILTSVTSMASILNPKV